MNVFDSKSTSSILYILGSTIAMTTAFWMVGMTFLYGQNIESIERKKQQWQSVEPDNYTYTVHSGCMYTSTTHVEVKNGKQWIVQNSQLKETIESLFVSAHLAMQSADRYDIQYNETYGFVEHIDVTWESQATDNTCFYQVSDFRLIN